MTAYGGCAWEAFEPAWIGKCPGLPPRVQPPPIHVVVISAEDALVHVALYLRGAYEAGSKALEYLREEGRGMYWSSLHSIELAEGLVEAILDGIESPTDSQKKV